ncbi:MAG: hypothetical protein KF908_05390 [Nitrosomonas sp.]|nr:hypothetical protein [Nitrosomonas sp.]
MNKNTDMKLIFPSLTNRTSKPRLDYDTIIALVAIASMIIVTAIDWRSRAQIIDTANQIITERDDRIDQLENIIDQIYMQHMISAINQ